MASDTHKMGEILGCLRKPQDMGGVVVVVMEEVGGHRLQLMIRTSHCRENQFYRFMKKLSEHWQYQ